MPGTNTLPLEKTPDAAAAPLDLSVYGVILPVLTTEPTDSMFGTSPPDGTLVLQAGTTDAYYIQWVRLGGTWRATFMAT